MEAGLLKQTHDVDAPPSRTGATGHGHDAQHSAAAKQGWDHAHADHLKQQESPNGHHAGGPMPAGQGVDGGAFRAGSMHGTWTKGADSSTEMKMPNAHHVRPTLAAPYDPANELNRLHGDGDTATFSVTGGAKVAAPWLAGVPVPFGPQATAGYSVTVKQMGGGGPGEAPAKHPPKYQVTFERNQLAGAYAQVSAGKGDSLLGKIGGEVGVAHADRVTMTFGTKDNAARAIRILQGEAEAQSLRSVGMAANPALTVPDPVAAGKRFGARLRKDPISAVKDALDPAKDFKRARHLGETVLKGVLHDGQGSVENPLHGDSKGDAQHGTVRIPLGQGPLGQNPLGPIVQAGAEAAAERVQPKQSDEAFLRSHLTGYEEALGRQDRMSVEGKLGNFGIDLRGTRNTTVTRTVTLGNASHPGSVSYELKGSTDLSHKDKLKFEGELAKIVPHGGGENGKVLKSLGLSTVTPVGQVSIAARLTYGMSARQEADLVRSNGTDVPGPSNMKAARRLDVTIAGNASLSAPTGIFGGSPAQFQGANANYTFKGTLDHPAARLGGAEHTLLHGGVGSAIDTLTQHMKATGEVTLTKTQGANFAAEPGVSLQGKGTPYDGSEAKLTLGAQAQTETVVARARGTLQHQAPPPKPHTASPGPVHALHTPSRPSTAADKPAAYQVVVQPHAGLNIRAEPGVDQRVLGAADSGTFLHATGQSRRDAAGHTWLQVKGPDADHHSQAGWVDASYVTIHRSGGEDATGRINELRRQGYVAVRVRPGDTLGELAARHGVRPSDGVAVNNGHIIDPNLIFPGDTVYLPRK